MPIFEYSCEHCNYTFDKLVMHQEADVDCPLCQGEVKKLMSTFSVGVPDKVSSKLPPGPSRPMCTTC
jgi:putative FmdB family regulatory protein